VEYYVGHANYIPSKVKNFNYKIVYGFIFEDVLWIRLFFGSYGLCIQKKPMVYSLNGIRPLSIPLLCGWRIALLKAIK